MKAAPLWLMLQLTARSDLQNYSFQIVIKQLETIKKQRLLNESRRIILKSKTQDVIRVKHKARLATYHKFSTSSELAAAPNSLMWNLEGQSSAFRQTSTYLPHIN